MEEIKTNIPKEKKTCHIESITKKKKKLKKKKESITVDEFVKDAPPRR